jgi:hypothetical protein
MKLIALVAIGLGLLFAGLHADTNTNTNMFAGRPADLPIVFIHRGKHDWMAINQQGGIQCRPDQIIIKTTATPILVRTNDEWTLTFYSTP